MSEIVEDLKISNIEVASNLGIRLTGSNPQIKSTTTGATLNITSGGGITLGTSGTSTIGFFGAIAVDRPTATGNTTTVTAGSTTQTFVNTTFNGGSGTGYTIGDIVKALKELGLLTQ
jgi:hypothetical protein